RIGWGFPAGVRLLRESVCRKEPRMNSRIMIGAILLIVGVLLLGWQGVAYFTTHEPVLQVGPFQVFGPVQHAVWLGPVIGGVILFGGLVMLLMGAGRKAT